MIVTNVILIALIISVLGGSISYAQTNDLSTTDDSLDFCLNEANELKINGEFSEEIKKLKECLQIDPNNIQILLEQGKIFFQLERYTESKNAYVQVLDIEQKNYDALMGSAFLFFQQEKYNLAIRYFDRALDIRPDEWQPLGYKGLSLSLLGKSEEAIPYHDVALELNENPAALVSKAIALHEEGKYHQALDLYKQALEFPATVFVFANQGDTFAALGEHNEALNSFKQALAMNSKNVYSHIGQGLALFNLERYDESISSYNEAIKFSRGKNLNALVNLGDVHVVQNNFERASNLFDKALGINSVFLPALISKADFELNARENHTNAILYYNKALEVEPENLEALTGKANVLANQEKNNQAMRLYDRALEIDPNYFNALVGNAKVLSSIKNCDSIHYYQRALETDPDNTEVLDSLIEEENNCIDLFGNYENITRIAEGILAIGAVSAGLITYVVKFKRKVIK